jgi:hypothetical protein
LPGSLSQREHQANEKNVSDPDMVFLFSPPNSRNFFSTIADNDSVRTMIDEGQSVEDLLDPLSFIGDLND